MSNVRNFIKKTIRKCQYVFLSKSSLKVDWVREKNFGDVLNPILVEKLSRVKVQHVVPRYYDGEYLSVIGSILERANSNTIVWGSGFMRPDGCVISNPKKVYAVRGPDTRKKLLDQGIDCPEVYGDPALLLPKIYNPKKLSKYKIGVVAHYVDKENAWLTKIKNEKNVKIIDPITDNPFDVIDQILSCEKIVSSSLHGVIVADAYGIPSMWIELSKKVLGDGFKFVDYFKSVNRPDRSPVKINDDTSIEGLASEVVEHKISIDLDLLMASAPFLIDFEDAK
ncbi:MAG: polysaccharide pyruvyl transferase family protein [Gammaproteobacteria bacterium]|nr:polysaccharide pyruvyl transferase family protein [Gammaproteobacteria bacterium]